MSATIAPNEHWAENAPLAEAFRKFDGENPQVYEEILRLLQAWHRRRGAQKVGIGMLWEVMRWNLALRTDSDEPFKLNNNHRSFYARKAMVHHPPLGELFEIRGRESVCECSECEGTLFLAEAA